MRLKADQCARDFLIHTSIIATINAAYANHDASKRDPLEFVLNVLAQQDIPNRACLHFLHYWRNSHHPEHHLVRTLRPDLERQLHSKNDIRDVISELATLQAEFDSALSDPEMIDRSTMRDEDLPEFVADLLARRWQKELYAQRGFSSQELCSVSFQFLSKPMIPLDKVRTMLTQISKSDRIFLRFEAYQKLKREYPDIFP